MNGLILLGLWAGTIAPAVLADDIVWHWVPNNYPYDLFPQRIGQPIYPAGDFVVRTIEIDMDGDGQVDFEFRAMAIGPPNVQVVARGTNEVLTVVVPPPTLSRFAIALNRDEQVGSLPAPNAGWLPTLEPFNIGANILACENPGENCAGQFLDERHYVGVRFWAADGLHYGVLDVAGLSEFAGGILYGYGYNRAVDAPLEINQVPGPVRVHPPQIVRPGYMRLEWDSEVGKGYEIQAKEVFWWYWVETGIIINAVGTNTLVDLPLTGPARFFRVMRMD